MALTTCSECGGSVSDQAAACPHCGAPLRRAGGVTDFNALAGGGREVPVNPSLAAPPPKRKSRAGFWLGVLGIVIVLGLIGRAVGPGGGSSGGSSSARSNTTFTAEYGARKILEGVLKAPSTARFIETRILERIAGGYCLVRVVVDAQNSFGAMMRERHLVILRLVGDSYTYRPQVATINEDELPADNGLELFKILNGWGKD